MVTQFGKFSILFVVGSVLNPTLEAFVKATPVLIGLIVKYGGTQGPHVLITSDRPNPISAELNYFFAEL